MRIIHTVFSVGKKSGGIGPVVLGLCQNSKEDDIDKILYLRKGDLDENIGIKKIVYPNRNSLIFPSKKWVKEKLIGKSNETIFHLHGIWDPFIWVAALECIRNKTPYVISTHGMLKTSALKQSRIKKFIAKKIFVQRLLAKSDCVHALNLPEFESLRNFGYKGPICIIPNGIKLPSLNKVKGKKYLKGGEFHFLFLGRIHPVKSVFEMVKAFNSLKKANWVLRIYGWGDSLYVTQIAKLVSEIKRKKNIKIEKRGPAYGAEKEKAFLWADCFLLPSKGEGFPIAILEAWSYGVPVLMTEECNLSIGFKNYCALKIGWQVEEIKEGVRSFLLFNENEIKKMGMNGRLLCEKEFSWNLLDGKYLDLYKWVLSKNPKPVNVLES